MKFNSDIKILQAIYSELINLIGNRNIPFLGSLFELIYFGLLYLIVGNSKSIYFIQFILYLPI